MNAILSTYGAATAAFTFGMAFTPATALTYQANSLAQTLYRYTPSSHQTQRRSMRTEGTSSTEVFLSDEFESPVFERETSNAEVAVGELRRWATLAENWDGEGASTPDKASLKSASNFVRLLTLAAMDVAPMLNANGRAGLYWNQGDFYADLEFLGDDRIAYFIEKSSDKHKGIVRFESRAVPPVLSTLLETARVT